MCEYVFSVSELKALINNAGVMIFGEFEWLTEQHILRQIDVNLVGAMRTTKSFCSMLRKYRGTSKHPCPFCCSTVTSINNFLVTHYMHTDGRHLCCCTIWHISCVPTFWMNSASSRLHSTTQYTAIYSISVAI
jgi:NAD(P)-dependent dehydrogenase (short-subunit alcohol dehydrogenase family)